MEAGDHIPEPDRPIVAGRGLIGRVLAQATEMVLAAGSLDVAVGRIGRQLQPERRRAEDADAEAAATAEAKAAEQRAEAAESSTTSAD